VLAARLGLMSENPANETRGSFNSPGQQ